VKPLSSGPVVLLTLLLLGGCQSTPNSPRPAQLLDNYPDLSAAPFPDRVGTIPLILLDDLRVADHRPDYQAHPVSDAERELFTNTWQRMPMPLRKVVSAKVVAVYFVENFEGGGMTYFLWKKGAPKYVLIFNARVLTDSVSQWLTFRDNTAFALGDSGFKLEDRVAGDDKALLWLMLHEGAHVFDFSVRPRRPEPPKDFARRADLHFYDVENKPKVGAREASAVFENVKRSGYSSLYAVQNELEDFAELVACGTLEETLGLTIECRLTEPSGRVSAFDPLRNPKTKIRIDAALQALNTNLAKDFGVIP